MAFIKDEYIAPFAQLLSALEASEERGDYDMTPEQFGKAIIAMASVRGQMQSVVTVDDLRRLVVG